MFRSQVAVVQFLFFFLVWNAEDQEVTAQSLQSTHKDIVVTTLNVSTIDWDEIIEKNEVEQSLNPLDRYCKNVLDVVRGLEPKLSSATLSCDISETQRTGETINVELALLSNEMETIFSPNPWFPSLKHTLESGIVNKESTWITDIISVSDPKPLDRESYLFIKDYGKNVVTIDKCSELKEVMSRRYPGFGELVKSCFFDVKSGNIKTEMNYLELMKKGYCCTNYNIYRRIHWSIMELLFGEQHGDKTKPSGISQPDKTTDKKENLGGDKTEPSGISQPDKTTDKKENLGGDKTKPSGISQPDKTTDKKENLGGDKTEPSGISQPDKTTDKKENLGGDKTEPSGISQPDKTTDKKENLGGDKTKPSGISQPDKTTDKKENLGGDKTEPSGISQPDKTTDKKENLGGDKTKPSGISQPDKTTDKKENLLGGDKTEPSGISQPDKTTDKKENLGGDKTEPSGISQPDKTTDKKENLLGLPSIIRISELENLKLNYAGHCIYASFPSGRSDDE
uniref:Egg protein n=1 Tax=Schistosoma mansoni TaxID=6183 RepID=A0A5K4FCQ5_SCHMA